ncbi:hypothetical protein [Arthrobacter agilis]|nr:hypothetical protein [Arthrobacter agilis]MDQ0734669.1 hypothetical protein [Arthrobacter agilis]
MQPVIDLLTLVGQVSEHFGSDADPDVEASLLTIENDHVEALRC